MALLLLSVLTLLAIVFAVRKARRPSRPLPPGPKPRPLIGNILDIPKTKPWLGYRDLCKQYGDVVFLQIPMQPILILGSAKAASDLLEKRSNVYSDRFQLVMMKLIAWDFSMALLPYGDDWRAHRRAFHQYFNQNKVSDYQEIQTQEVRAFLSRILDSPESSRAHIRQLFVAIILRIVYGMKVKGLDDDYIMMAERALDGANIAGVPGANWVEYLPFLQYIPSWVPGGRTQRLVEEYRPLIETMLDDPLKKVKNAMDNGTAVPSMANALLGTMQERLGTTNLPPDQERLLRNVTGVAYFGAADTSASAGESFLLAMAMHPEVQKKAQAELDRVVGPDRLPSFADIKSLVYIRAVSLEVSRWIPTGPLAVPHRLTVDDEYNGYLIPKGTLAIPNAWAMLHDPHDYPEPELFKPERFIKDGKLDPNVRDPNNFAFGFGRRICPGRHLGAASLSLYIASTLHVFNITAGLDSNGQPMQLSTDVCDGFISRPMSVPTGLKPRSEAAERLIREAVVFT